MAGDTGRHLRSVKIYPRFERFWHWSQVILIGVLLFTGLAVSGVHSWLDFSLAARLHVIAALLLVVLWIFAIFWHFTTGTWVHYVPRAQGLGRVIRFYSWGIFKGEPHPYRKAFWRKHNPLQALTYLALKLVLFPAVWITGFLYLGYTLWDDAANAPVWLSLVANIHVLAALAIAAFVIVHIYLLTVGESFLAHLRPMLSGYDNVELTPQEEAYLETDEPARIR